MYVLTFRQSRHWCPLCPNIRSFSLQREHLDLEPSPAALRLMLFRRSINRLNEGKKMLAYFALYFLLVPCAATLYIHEARMCICAQYKSLLNLLDAIFLKLFCKLRPLDNSANRLLLAVRNLAGTTRVGRTCRRRCRLSG